ncbi:MAG: carbon-nitrogen hydrolase family protein [Candidatus Omnitrophica bacterium]|nr:carbon-nitrogen hydrolase family protein [Candidatus Omnitrophota bacterium]MDE2009530.1 carbon-nitrogen hydrolase family protein [Candidatus Omnitrophota bacterium]MDE2214574.1 carbon-nitrogen hydrolase family protein [Candidatus Omnitrophota bacterium]MDE2231651.1 carbon-nitrogen hydrolase family protein [Candidatus Omnitrophota bacterium]
MKVALIQFCSAQDKADNLKRATGMVQEALAQGARFVLLPEVFNFRAGADNKQILQEAAEPVPGPSVRAFFPLAQKYKACLLLGSIIEKAGAGYAYNTSVVIDSGGSISAKYRKIHLFDARLGDKIIREAGSFLPGNKITTVKIGEFRAGLSICYDVRFPGLYQRYARRGVEVLTVPSCFTKKTGQAHWETLLRARAIENLAYVLAPAQVGTDGRGIEAHGHSMIVSPWGEVTACGSPKGQEIVFGQIDLREVKKARQSLPGIIK